MTRSILAVLALCCAAPSFAAEPFSDFEGWLVRWQSAPDAARGALLAEGTRLAQACGLANALPPPGDALRVWASRWLGVREGRLDAARALVRAALHAAVAKHIHVVQVNLPEDDPLLHALPPYPRSTYWSTLYGCPLEGGARAQPATSSRAGHGPYHVDLALV